MSDFGAWVPATFNNGAAPAIDEDVMNSYEDWIDIADEELRKSQSIKLKDFLTYFWQRNIKVIDDFTASSEWTAAAGSVVANDTTNNVIGYNAVKLSDSNDLASWVSMYRAATLDLSQFHDGSASSTSDWIVCLFYISDITKFTLFQLKLGTDNANNWYKFYNPAGFSNGWNVIMAQKSGFTEDPVGPNWNNITYIRMDLYTAAGASTHYFTFQYLMMVRDYGGVPAPYQQYMGATTGWSLKFDIYDYFNSVIYDEKINRLGIVMFDPRSWIVNLLLYSDVEAFSSKFEMYCKYAGNSSEIIWAGNVDNYAKTYIGANVFYLIVAEAGVETSTSIALTNSLLLNERVIIEFEKDSDTFRAILSKNGEVVKTLEYEAIGLAVDSGEVYLADEGTNYYSLVTDFAISSNKNCVMLENEEANGPRLVRLSADQTYANDTITAITDFLIRLKPNRVYKVEAFINAHNAGSAAADLKIDWASSGVSLLGLRNCVGSESTSYKAQPNNTTHRCSSHGITAAVYYALSASGTYVAVKEDFIVKTTQAGGYIQMRAAQYNTTGGGGNETIVDDTSYVLITEVFCEK
jgi:hypothetical protein